RSSPTDTGAPAEAPLAPRARLDVGPSGSPGAHRRGPELLRDRGRGGRGRAGRLLLRRRRARHDARRGVARGPERRVRRPSCEGADLVGPPPLGALREVAVQRGPATIVLLKDDRSRKSSLDGAFGTLVQEAADLMVNPRVVV